MRLVKSAPKDTYTFIAPSDSGINWEESAREIYKTTEILRKDYKNQMDAQGYSTLTDEQLEKLFVETCNPKQFVLNKYIKSNFDRSILKGDPIALIIEEVTPSDHQVILDSGKIGVETNTDEANINLMKNMINTFLTHKLNKIDYPASVPASERLEKQELVEMFLKEMTFEDVNLFFVFVKSMVQGFVKKN